MIKDSREEEFLTKEGGTSDTTKQKTSTSTLWSTHRNPRIVRVSQAFGGKDRHSKVNTIRGLRDRRVRLSVPTAIQLYDLQEKLGLNQPSKVVDWLLNAAQHEIDKLPSLPIHLIQFPQYLSSSSAINDGITENITSSENISNKVVEDVTQFQNSAYWNSYGFMKSKSVREMTLESDIEMSYNSYNQFEPNVPQEEVAQGFQSMMPSSLSLYGNNHSNLQIPSTFAQLFPANSSRTSLHAGQEYEKQ